MKKILNDDEERESVSHSYFVFLVKHFRTICVVCEVAFAFGLSRLFGNLNNVSMMVLRKFMYNSFCNKISKAMYHGFKPNFLFKSTNLLILIFLNVSVLYH